MKTAIHQPHYFPWIGYFDKIAKVDKFILLDQVQFEKGSQMIRNRVVSDAGVIKYITISADTKSFLEKEYRDILIKNADEWKTRQKNALKNYYRNAEFSDETMKILEEFWKNNYPTVCEWTCKSIELICELLGIDTELLYQSNILYEKDNKRSDLVLSICKSIKADYYFAGKGASVRYLDIKKFKSNGIDIVFQDFQHPFYKQCSSETFIPGVSVIDMLFNCGIKETKRIFWENVNKKNEFEIAVKCEN